MTVTVDDLIHLPQLQLTIVGGEGGVGRGVTWAHCCDLAHPWEWLSPGELLLTNGIGLGPAASAQVKYLEQLHEIGASGLVLGLGTAPCTLTERLIRCADALGMPVLTAPYSLRFTAIVRAVAHANELEESDQLFRVARLYEVLREALAGAAVGPELLVRLGREFDVRLNLVALDTGQLLRGDEHDGRLTDALVDAYRAHGETIPGLLRLSGPDGHTGAVAVAVPGAVPAALVVESSTGQFPGTIVLEHLAIGAGLELAGLVAEEERRYRLGSEFLADLLEAGVDTPRHIWQLDEASIDLAACVLACVRSAAQISERIIHARLLRSQLPHLAVERDGGLIFVLLSEAAASQLPSLVGRAVGISCVLQSPIRALEAKRESEWALGAAEAEGHAVAHYGEMISPLLPRTPMEAQAIVDRVLGPLLVYDSVHRTEYVQTLAVLLEHDRSWKEASAQLHIHRQTLAYRLRKIDQLTGRGTTRTDDLAEWWFALRALGLLGGTQRRVVPNEF